MVGRPYDSSSSSDDDGRQGYRSNIHLQNIDLGNYKKKKKSNVPTKSGIAKASKKIKNKTVRFPDSYAPRDNIMSTSANRSSSDSDSDSYDDIGDQGEEAGLPSFSGFQGSREGQVSESSSSSSASSDEGAGNPQGIRNIGVGTSPVYAESLHTSSDESDAEEHVEKSPVRSSKSSRSSRSSKSSKREDVNEKHATVETNSSSSANKDESRLHTEDSNSISRYVPSEKPQGANKIQASHSRSSSKSGTSLKSSESGKWKGLKGILRRVSLAGQNEPEQQKEDDSDDDQNSNTFLGRVMDTSNRFAQHDSQSIATDEEANVGHESPELKRVNFEELNNEAQNLISAHIPGVTGVQSPEPRHSVDLSEDSRSHSPKAANAEPNIEEGDSSNAEKHGFYAQNPEFYLRGDSDDGVDNDDYMMLDEDTGTHVAPPKNVQAGVLSSLLKLYQNPLEEKSASSLQTGRTWGGTTLADDDEFMEEANHLYHTTASDLSRFTHGIKKGGKAAMSKLPTKKLNFHRDKRPVSKNMDSGDEYDKEFAEKYGDDGTEEGASFLPSFQNARPKFPKKSQDLADKVKRKKFKNHQKRLRITVHIADILQRQRFILRMCRALMLFGAPTHRLEEYMVMTSRVLELDGQFIYFPGCMIVSFGDAATRTSEVHLVRCAQGLNLSKLSDTHRIYKSVIHDLIGVDDASNQLESLLKKKNLYSKWLCVLFYGFGSAMVTPFAFSGGWRDIPISFGVGLCVGYLQFFLASKSNLYSSVFEVAASIVVSFIGRAIGSISGGNIFCFSAITQGSLALILPGYIILCGSLELQSRNMVAGSVRMFYAIIYSLFLGFGITLGTALYGWIDKGSTSREKCMSKYAIDDRFRIIFVPAFSIALGLINQARFRQLPVMVVISCAGYVATYFAGKHFESVTEFNAAIGAFVVGVLGNLYSRVWKGMAVSAMLPAIFVQVPSGIASQGTLISGVRSANQLTHSNSTSSSTSTTASNTLGFGVVMVEVSIGISVGLFAAALVVYPLGKRKTGIFSL